jgi:hopene-associated glycosyltransferase HpnB
MSALAFAALLAWAGLMLLRGGYWRRGPELAPAVPRAFPPVAVVVPARDEAATVAEAVGSLLAQDYAGRLRVVLVDDESSDGTGGIALGLPDPHGRLTVLRGAARPAGWAGKLWAVAQGVGATDEELVLLTDADIVHDRRHVATLVAAMERTGADLVSEMVRLNCESLAERALVPGFVYFFAMLYPFAWVNDPRRRTAAAAGGTVLVRRHALVRIGGIDAIRGALIDDVTLAAAVKRAGGRIWLGHSRLARSVRPYRGFGDIWRMVARSAYVQLRHSPLLLAGTILGLGLLFVVPPVAAFAGRWVGWGAWALMAASFYPSVRRFGLPAAWAAALPLTALFYMAATIGAALDHHRGRGVVWKSRAYREGRA